MISLDQVLMLQKKVETAVEKISFLKGQIEQLKSENDALHTKCAELTKALDEKTELVSSLESNQGKIEEGILSALNRLDTVENSLLDGSVEKASDEEVSEVTSEETISNEAQPEVSFDQQAPLTSEQSENNEQQTEQSEPAPQQQEPFRYEIVPDEEESTEENEDNSSEENSPQASENNADSLNGQFDIF